LLGALDVGVFPDGTVAGDSDQLHLHQDLHPFDPQPLALAKSCTEETEEHLQHYGHTSTQRRLSKGDFPRASIQLMLWVGLSGWAADLSQG
jgi:hypothetical protein